MPNQRTPLAKARLTGQAKKKPARYETREEPSVDEYPQAMANIGKPSSWLSAEQKNAFEGIKRCFPWLTESSRISVEIASKLYARLMDPEVVQRSSEISQLRALIAAFGGTPADLTKVAASIPVLATKARQAEEGSQRSASSNNNDKYFN